MARRDDEQIGARRIGDGLERRGQGAVAGVAALKPAGGRQLGDRPAPLALREPGQPLRTLRVIPPPR